MASVKKKKKRMVLHQEGATVPAGDHPPASEGGMEQSTSETSEEADLMGKPNMHPSKEAIRTAMKHPAGSDLQAENLSPDSVCKGIRVTLDNNSMWNEFYRCRTEMILTKQGSRMFPYCRFRISGLQPSRKYSLLMDIQSLDNSRYKWTGKSWQVAGKSECHHKGRPFAHPDSPSTGQHWMQNPVSFYKLKLTNDITDQEGNTVLRPMHRYRPRLHVVPTDKAAKDIKLNGSAVVTFTFAQTEFMAVAAYQNSRFVQLKVDYNPFTKGLKEDGTSWGLKLKSKPCKDPLRDGDTAADKQHPLRKSLKSLLANHKPRSAKAAESTPSVPEDLQKNSTTSKDQSAATVPEECSSHPPQKLFSELIREAHVSLQRCNLEQLGGSNCPKNERTNSQNSSSKRESVSVKVHSEESPERKETVTPKKKVQGNKDLLNPLNYKDVVRANCSEGSEVVAAPAESQVSVESHHRPAEQSELKMKQHKRPAPVPLPALALFLKQHSTKSKKAKNQLDSPLPVLPSESQSESQSSDADSAYPLSTGPSEAGYASKPYHHVSGCTGAQPDEMFTHISGQAVELAHHPSSPPCPEAAATTGATGDFLASSPEPVVPSTDHQCCSPGASISIISSTIATSSPTLSPPFDTVLPASESVQTPTITESSTLPLDSPTLKSDTLLSDPECSSFGFEPLSPASSPEPLPSLPTSLTLQLQSAAPEQTPKAGPPEELAHSKDSVFKWHTVLPPPERYIDASFTTQTFDNATSAPSPDPAPAFQENEQSLPFPAELSPLTLQLPLSPTFSALDGDGLSPTPSLTDLVHFFSNNDLEMGLDFSNTEPVAVPCPPPSAVESNAHEVSQQVQVPANKHYKRKSRKQRLAKTDPDQNSGDTIYTSLQPNLEEVEEQLFISFTSKEALQLHLLDSEENVSHPQTTPEGHLRPPTDGDENDKNVGGSSLPDGIHPQKFPAKLWHLVNNPENKAICWNADGDAIIIDQNVFERQVVSQGLMTSDTTDAFKTTNFSNFVRQLKLYGFKKAGPAPKDSPQPAGVSGSCHQFGHPNFKRRHPELVASMQRMAVGSKAKPKAGMNVNRWPPGQTQQVSGCDDGEENEKTETEEKVAALEKVLLRDLKLMRHRQVIHPVLQEVGLKMNLLDPSLAIDLQYLGVRLPIPPPGVSLEPLSPELPPSQGVCAAFVSRTGKTTDVTQIKGWREKFTPSEAPTAAAPPKPEAGPGSDLPKKNLSAFCSDMLDEYLENEGKLIDERASSFSSPLVEPPVYELPTRSTSYVRTLDSVLKKQTGTSSASDLISGFIPPSKRPKLKHKETKTSRRETMKQKGPKPGKPRSEPAATPTDSNLVPKQPPVSPQPPTFRKRRKLKPKTSSQTLSPPRITTPLSRVSGDMAPLESDSELGAPPSQHAVVCKKDGGLVMTRALLRQKDLEDGVLWEGRPRTSITEERASIALTSLFTLMGFVRENPTAPIQLVRRRAPPCLNEFCRLGCICSSLSYCSRISHCGRPACMLGCSCLKQKVVLLKNLDGSDSSPSRHASNKKRKRKRRMKMAYVLKEADSVSQPAERVQTLWTKDATDRDLDPTHVPKPAALICSTLRAEDHGSCARVRGYHGNKKADKQKVSPKAKSALLKSERQRPPKDAKTRPSTRPPAGEPAPLSLGSEADRPGSPPAEPPPKPSKRLIVVAECVWDGDADRSHVLKELCERMAYDQLDQPFWIKKYLISPMGQTVEGSGTDQCIQYRIHISMPKLEPERPVAPAARSENAPPQQDHLKQEVREAEPLEDWQREVEDEEEEPCKNLQRELEKEEAEPLEDWQQQVEEEEAEPLEDWQKQVEEEEAEPLEDWQQQVEEEEAVPLEEWQQQVEEEEVEPLEDWQKQVKEEEADPLEDWQRQVMEEKAEPCQDLQQEIVEGADSRQGLKGQMEEKAEPQWDREVVEDDINEAGSTVHQVHDGKDNSREEVQTRPKKKCGRKMVAMGLPFLAGISPAGFISANRKQRGGTDHVIRVNGKLYPLAKIQLGKMGALHPANRLAAYLTGRVGSNKKQQAPSSSSAPSKPPQNQGSGLAPQTALPASYVVSGPAVKPPPRSQPLVKVLTIPTTPTVIHAPTMKLNQSAAFAAASGTPEGAGSRVVMMKVFPGPKGGAKHVRVVAPTSVGSAPNSASQVSSAGLPAKSTQLLMVPVVPLPGKAPAPRPAPCPPTSISSGQRMVLQPVKTVSGVQYYRRADGHLFQLVPINQLRAVKPNPPVRSDSAPSILPAAVHQTVVSHRLPVTIVTTSSHSSPAVTTSSSSSSSSSSSLSGLQSVSVPCLPSPLLTPPGVLSQNRTCTLNILPPAPTKEPVVVPCAEVSSRAPVNMVAAPGSSPLLQSHPPTPSTDLISLKPSTEQGAESGTVPESALPVGPASSESPAHRPPPPPAPPVSALPVGPASPQSPAPPPAPPVSEVTPVPAQQPPGQTLRPKLELACNMLDLDIICVDDGTELATTETAGRAKPPPPPPPPEVVELDSSSSSETDNSSDFEDNTDSEDKSDPSRTNRLNHNMLEKQRREKLRRLFDGLRREVGQSEKTSKVSTLRKAVQVIQQLAVTETDLMKRKRRLTERRDSFLCSIAPAAGSEDADVTAVVDLRDERTDNSPDEEEVAAKVPKVEVQSEDRQQNVAPPTPEVIAREQDSVSRLTVKTLVSVRSVAAAFRDLRSVMDDKASPPTLLLEKAQQEILTLQRANHRLRSVKICLKQQRDAYVRQIAKTSGKSEQKILEMLQHLSSKQEKMGNQYKSANQLPAAARGGAADASAGDTTDEEVAVLASTLPPQAPPTPVSASPTTTPVHTFVQLPQTSSQGVLQVSKPSLAPPGVSHNAAVLQTRPKTVPNILSRSKVPASRSILPKKTMEECFQTVVPAEVLSLVGAVLPGQQVLTLNTMLAGQTLLQTSPPGVSSVSLNIPTSITNQQLHLTTLPHPPTGKIYSGSAPLSITELSASKMLQLVQPQQQPKQQQVPGSQPLPPPPPPPLPLVVSARSDLSTDQIKDQDQSSSCTDTASEPSSSPPSTQGGTSSLGPGPHTGLQAEVRVGGAQGAAETSKDPDNVNLTSLLDEIVFLNQQPISAQQQEEEEAAHSPWLLQLDSDSDDPVTMETEEAGLNDHRQASESRPLPGLSNGNTTGGVLVPPPLLQMKVGGAKVVDPASRPMPRLVPLGLRGNPPS